MELFEFAIIFDPDDSKVVYKPGEKKILPELLHGPCGVVALNDHSARTKAAAFIPEKYQDRLDEVKIYVKPFFGSE